MPTADADECDVRLERNFAPLTNDFATCDALCRVMLLAASLGRPELLD
jgi:hypothetical protein